MPDQLDIIQGQTSHLEENKEDADRHYKRDPIHVKIEAHNKDAHEAPEDGGCNPVLELLAGSGGILVASRVPVRNTDSLWGSFWIS